MDDCEKCIYSVFDSGKCESCCDYCNYRELTPNEYQNAVERTMRKPDKHALTEGILGLCGEAGEVADAFKKARFQGHEEPDVEEELGDVLWYVAMIAKLIGSDLETVMFRNIEKLRERYPDGFEVERSVNRK